MRLDKIAVVLFLVMMVITPSVSAASENIALNEGETVKGDTKVDLTNGEVTFETGDLKATAYTEIDGTKFDPASTKHVGDALVWESGEKQYFVFDDPTVSTAYQYSGKKLKETITLKEDKQLSFPVSLGADSKLIPWDDGSWKIVSASSGDTMKGIVIEKPYGIDATGKRIEMEYTYVDGKLNLEYNRTITTYTSSEIIIPAEVGNASSVETRRMIITPVYSEITYPLVIDPTWVSTDGRWEDSTTVPGYTLVMWNATGTTTWTVPDGVTTISYLVVAGGASGGRTYGAGGGAGAVLTGTELAVSGTETIVVGPGGATTTSTATGNDGGISSLTNDGATISATGGGGGGNYTASGRNGGSGGGASGNTGMGALYGSGTTGGNDGGRGNEANPYPAGGGGGAGEAGHDASPGVCGAGGDGVFSSITGDSVPYGGGGGGSDGVGTATLGAGGLGGGGAGAHGGANAVAGTANTGGGGGGASGGGNGGAGGSGIVIIKYSTPVGDGLSLTSTPIISSIYATNVLFTATGNATLNPQNWTFGDGYTSQVRNVTNHYYSVAGNYTATLSTTNQTAPFGFVNATVYLNQTSDTDANLKSWMHMNGTAGGTTFTDIQGNAWSSSSVTTETAQKKFGYSSALFNANDDRLQTPSSSNFDFGTSNFTIEQWVYPTASANGDFIVSRTSNAGTKPDGWGIYHSTASATSDGWRVWFGTTATQTGTFTLPLNSWSHLVVQRDGAGNVVVYTNGTSVATVTAAGNYDTANAIVYGNPIGGGGSVDSAKMYLDETRISTTSRWNIDGSSTTFSPPWAEYRGDLFTIYPDPNPGSTLRFKTNPTATPPSPAAISNLTPRNRTVQIQYVNITNNISTTVYYNPDVMFVEGVYANTSTYSGINFTKVVINPSIGTVLLNITRPGGFSTTGLTDNRASVADLRMVYWNYTEPKTSAVWDESDIINQQYFGQGFLKNSTTSKDYPVQNFIATNVTFLDWITFSNFTVSNPNPYASATNVVFETRNNKFAANRFDWDFGDGSFANTTNGSATHIYTTPGDYSVSSRAYLWQNNSVTNTTTLLGAVNVTYDPFYIGTDFIGSPTSGEPGQLVSFTDLTVVGNSSAPLTCNWSFGDSVSLTPYSSVCGDVQHVYTYAGVYDVNLSVTMFGNTSYEHKTQYIAISVDNVDAKLNVLYPREVQFACLDVYSNPLTNMTVTAVMTDTTNDGTNWLYTLFGITADTTPINTTLMVGTTDEGGAVAFPMIATARYTMTFTSIEHGVSATKTVSPQQLYFVYLFPTTQSIEKPNMADYINGTLYTTDHNATTVNLSLAYSDIGLSTTALTFYVDYANGTRLYTLSSFANYNLANATYMMPNTKSASYAWGYSAQSTMFGFVNESSGILLKGVSGRVFNLDPCGGYATGWGDTC